MRQNYDIVTWNYDVMRQHDGRVRQNRVELEEKVVGVDLPTLASYFYRDNFTYKNGVVTGNFGRNKYKCVSIPGPSVFHMRQHNCALRQATQHHNCDDGAAVVVEP